MNVSAISYGIIDSHIEATVESHSMPSAKKIQKLCGEACQRSADAHCVVLQSMLAAVYQLNTQLVYKYYSLHQFSDDKFDMRS